MCTSQGMLDITGYVQTCESPPSVLLMRMQAGMGVFMTFEVRRAL